MFNKFCSFILLLISGSYLLAQDISLPNNYENGSTLNVIYRNDISGKLYLYTRGVGINFHQGRHVTSNSRTFYEIDIRTLNHPKQVKLTGEAETRRRFVYGQINKVMVIAGNLGMQKVLFAKGDNKAVEVRYAYSLGPVFAIAKPYYILVEKKTDYIQFNNENFTPSIDRILGRAPFSKGMNEIKFYPGLNAQFKLSFEYAPYTNLVRAIETGISLDIYPKALPIMANNPAENAILTLHIGLVFGTKWY
jgi:hypothetical protein